MDEESGRAFGFEGSWRGYAPIAFSNLLLTIVTLGIYRFWATTRTRHYLWSHTRFIDEHLEWTGKGLELLIGFLLVVVLIGMPFVFLQFGAQALILQGHVIVASALTAAAFLVIFYLGGLARFRAIRYRLSRTFWHGIRGGSDVQGWLYGWSWMWRSTVGMLALGLLTPWAMVTLWNNRWGAMSFGPHPFKARALSGAVFKRFLLFYLFPIILIFAFIVVGAMVFGALSTGAAGRFGADPKSLGLIIVSSIIALVLIYGTIGVIALAFYAKYFRVVIGGLSLSTLDFRFDARSKAWFKLILGDIGLVLVTLGIGLIFLSYRHWKFFITHLDASGEISLSDLTQSTTRTPGQGEGLLDAFDIGAI